MDNWIYGSSIMDVDRWNALPVQSFPYSSRRITLVFPFYSLPYFSFLKGISTAQALLLLPLVAPMVAGQLSSFEQLRQAWLGSVVLDNQRLDFTFFTLVRSEATQATIGAQSGSREDRWKRLTTFNSWVWHWHNARKLMICAGLLPAHIPSTWTMDRSVSFYLLLWWIACVWRSYRNNYFIHLNPT